MVIPFILLSLPSLVLCPFLFVTIFIFYLINQVTYGVFSSSLSSVQLWMQGVLPGYILGTLADTIFKR